MDDRDASDDVDVPVIWLENIQIVGVILPEIVDCFHVNPVVKINFKVVPASHLSDAPAAVIETMMEIVARCQTLGRFVVTPCPDFINPFFLASVRKRRPPAYCSR